MNVETGLTEWFGSGADTSVSLVDALYASAALPVFYPPARVNEHGYVDGGVPSTPFPLHRAVELGATGIVGVDVGSGKQSHPHRLLAQGMLAIHMRVFSIMSWRNRSDMVTHWTEPPLLFVRPRLGGYQTFDFENVQYFFEEARAALLGEGPSRHVEGWGALEGSGRWRLPSPAPSLTARRRALARSRRSPRARSPPAGWSR